MSNQLSARCRRALVVALSLLVLVATPVAHAATTPAAEDADWILSAQLPDGAIAHHVDHVRIWPYLSNFAAMGLARASMTTGNTAYRDAAWRWLNWYQAHEDANGFVTDYTVANGVATSTGDMDSTDAYAGTFLLAARYTWKATGNLTKLKKLATGINGAVRAIEATQDVDGLTWAKPAWRVKYLMDQAETYAGLRAAAEIGQAIGNKNLRTRATADADRMAKGIASLWNPTTNAYDWAKHDTGARTATNWSVFYPDALQQAWAVAFGLTDPTRASSLLGQFNTAFPNWDDPTSLVSYDTGLQAANYRSVVGWAELIAGDTARAATGATRIRAAALATNRAWPFTPGDAGQLILLESAATDFLATPVATPALRLAAATPAPASGSFPFGVLVALISMSIAAPTVRRVRHGVTRSAASRYSPVRTRR
jgi:hypothetical protein